MASDLAFVQFATDQMASAGKITYRKMFGEFAIYSGTKVVALICDNQLFVKATDKGREFIGTAEEASAYPGAKPGFVIRDQLEDHTWISELIKITARALPEPKPKKKIATKKILVLKKVKPKKKSAATKKQSKTRAKKKS